MIYWDTSAIVPLYIEEPSTSFWETVLEEAEPTPRSSQLALTEFGYALHHKIVRGILEERAAQAVMAKFSADCEAGRWALYPLGGDIIKASLEVAVRCRSIPCPVLLRSLDGLHLGTARVLSCNRVATGDRRLADAAKATGMRILFPEKSEP